MAESYNERPYNSEPDGAAQEPTTTINDSHPSAPPIMLHQPGSEDARQFTMRAVCAGLLVGTVVNFSNMYFGLQSGHIL